MLITFFSKVFPKSKTVPNLAPQGFWNKKKTEVYEDTKKPITRIMSMVKKGKECATDKT